MDARTKVDMLLKMIQQIADDHPNFFVRKGQGVGNLDTNLFVTELNKRALEEFGVDHSEKKICGETNHAVDYYFQDEAAIVEVALSLWTPNSEFEKDILKALMAQEHYPVKRLVLIGKPGSVEKCKSPSRKSIIDWARRTHSLNIEVHDILNNHGL
jgi:hypothetical protein